MSSAGNGKYERRIRSLLPLVLKSLVPFAHSHYRPTIGIHVKLNDEGKLTFYTTCKVIDLRETKIINNGTYSDPSDSTIEAAFDTLEDDLMKNPYGSHLTFSQEEDARDAE